MPVARHLQRPNPRASGGRPALLFGLAPGGVYRASPVTRTAGELLPHRFTLTVSRRRAVLRGTAAWGGRPRPRPPAGTLDIDRPGPRAYLHCRARGRAEADRDSVVGQQPRVAD